MSETEEESTNILGQHIQKTVESDSNSQINDTTFDKERYGDLATTDTEV